MNSSIRTADFVERVIWHASTPSIWAADPFRLLSLWIMLRFHAGSFSAIVKMLGRIEGLMAANGATLANLLSTRGFTPQEFRLKIQENKTKEIKDPFFEEASAEWNKISVQLEDILITTEKACKELALATGLRKILRIRAQLGAGLNTPDEIRALFKELGERIEDELSSRLFMQVPAHKSKYYSEKQLCGPEVAAKFLDSTEDIEEAGKCYALGRYTATVFHLMRVMERGVDALAKKLGVSINPPYSWGPILGQVDQAIKAMPTGTPQQSADQSECQGLSASLHAVKDAWRNATMHPKATYTEEEAEEIFNNVKAFMRRLSSIC